ncbi:MAG: dihydroneopterin aldolase [Succinivibrio sp.]|nr:dihydroneopterin aldolase [Succinivibrio sp.]
MDKIFIAGLRVPCIIGILPEERQTEQPLMLDLTLETSLQEAGLSHDLKQSIDYAALSREVYTYVRERKAGLLEELGVELCELILSRYRPQRVTIRLGKPQALQYADLAGIEISRCLDGVEDVK